MAVLVARPFERVLHEVAGLPRPAMRAVVPVLEQAERELARGLARWLHANDADARFTGLKYRSLLVQIREALATARTTEPVLYGALAQSSRRAASMAARHVDQQLHEFAGSFGAPPVRLPLRIVEHLASGEAPLLDRLESGARRYAGQLGRDIRRELAVGVARGESVSELTARLGRLGGLRRPGAVADDVARGLFRRHHYAAERLVRTELQSIYNLHAQQSIEEAARLDPEIRQRWDASLDSRTCMVCAALDGEIAIVDEAFSDGTIRPPRHPCCLCILVAWRSDWGRSGRVTR